MEYFLYVCYFPSTFLIAYLRSIGINLNQQILIKNNLKFNSKGYSDEEIEVEEEIEYIDEDDGPIGEENQVDAGDNEYVPETFEQLNAMYRTKDYQEETEQKIKTKPLQTEAFSYQSPYTTSSSSSFNNSNSKFAKEESPKTKSFNETQNQDIFKTSAPVFEAPPPPPPLVKAKIEVQPKYLPTNVAGAVRPESLVQPIKKDVTYDMDYEKVAKTRSEVEPKKEISYDMDYQPEAEDIDYDEDDMYDDDEVQDDDSEDLLEDDDDNEEDLEEGDDEDVSDVDDSELMNRLEAKYGKLPAKEYESDEDPDDPTWTRNY